MCIIGFLGRAGSGKDTAADYLVKHHNYVKISFATPLKDICEILFGFSKDQLYGDLKEVDDKLWRVSPRRVMQYLGTDIFRNRIDELLPDVGNNFWVNSFKIKYLNEIKKDPNFKCVVADVRFQNEIDIINELGGTVIRIHRNIADNSSSKYSQHESENNIDNLTGVINNVDNNSSLEDMYNSIEKIM